MSKLYKNNLAKAQILALYDEKLDQLNLNFEVFDINTRFCTTRVYKTGNPSGKVVVLFHGINAGSPVTLEAVKELSDRYLFYAIDTPGQTTRSEEYFFDIYGDDYAVWAEEVLEQLSVTDVAVIGISYGAYILQKIMIHRPNLISKAIMVVPAGLVNGKLIESMVHLTVPLTKFMITKNEKHLKRFVSSFVPDEDDYMFKFQKCLLNGVNIDFRRPKLIKNTQVLHFEKPVYVMVADNDVFFPGMAALERAKKVFPNLQQTYILNNCKHLPGKERYPEIQRVVSGWIG